MSSGGLTVSMVRDAVYDEYGSMFVDVADEFDTWITNLIRRADAKGYERGVEEGVQGAHSYGE